MTDIEDPSRARDAVAAETAAKRSHDLTNTVQVMSLEINAVKSGLAANTAITKEIVDRQQEMHTRQVEQSAGLDSIREDTKTLVDLIRNAKTGGRWATAFADFMQRCAKYLTPIVVFIGAVYALWHTKGGK